MERIEDEFTGVELLCTTCGWKERTLTPKGEQWWVPLWCKVCAPQCRHHRLLMKAGNELGGRADGLLIDGGGRSSLCSVSDVFAPLKI